MTDERKRNWSFILYPESAPSQWRTIIANYHVPTIISPLHDKDKENGKVKKAHYHIVMLFPSKKRYTQMKHITDVLSAPIPKSVVSIQGLIRYFAHLDNPEKAQYDPQKIEGICGADPAYYLASTKADQRQLLKEISTYIINNHITSLSYLVDKILNDNNDRWFTVVAISNPWYITMLLNSEWKLKHQNRYK